MPKDRDTSPGRATLCPDFLLPGETSARPLKRFFEKDKTGPADSGTIQQRHRFDKN